MDNTGYTDRMDRKIEKATGIRAVLRKKNIPWFLAGLFAIFLIWLILSDNTSTLRIDGSMATIETVVRGEFNDYIRLSGQVQPITTVQVSPLEGGIVEQIVAEEGTSIRKGDVIVILSNNNLSLEILNSEAQLAEKENFLRNTMIAMEQERLRLQQDRLQLEMDVIRKKRRFMQNDALFAEQLIPREEWLEAKEDYEIAEDGRILVMERQKQDSLYRSVQIEQLEESLDNMRRNMMLIRQRIDNLNIKSPIDGELGLLDVVLGQSVSMGYKLGQINDLSDYKIEAQIDEHYIDRISPELEGSFDRQGAQFRVRLRKVYPEVRENKFKADFTFEGDRPDNIRSGQTYSLNLQLGQPAEAVIIPRGSFYAKTGGSWIYVLSDDGKKAYKRNIRIGRQNPQYYEVSEGLQPGEKVIVSGYEGYGEKDVLIFK